MIGGRIPYGIHFQNSLRNHIHEDIGVEIEILSGINYPDFVYPYSKEKPDLRHIWGHDPTKYALGLTYLATFDWTKVKFGKKSHSRPEAKALHWFSLETMPKADEFGYGHETPFGNCLWKATNDAAIIRKLPHVI